MKLVEALFSDILNNTDGGRPLRSLPPDELQKRITNAANAADGSGDVSQVLVQISNSIVKDGADPNRNTYIKYIDNFIDRASVALTPEVNEAVQYNLSKNLINPTEPWLFNSNLYKNIDGDYVVNAVAFASDNREKSRWGDPEQLSRESIINLVDDPSAIKQLINKWQSKNNKEQSVTGFSIVKKQLNVSVKDKLTWAQLDQYVLDYIKSKVTVKDSAAVLNQVEALHSRLESLLSRKYSASTSDIEDEDRTAEDNFLAALDKIVAPIIKDTTDNINALEALGINRNSIGKTKQVQYSKAEKTIRSYISNDSFKQSFDNYIDNRSNRASLFNYLSDKRVRSGDNQEEQAAKLAIKYVRDNI